MLPGECAGDGVETLTCTDCHTEMKLDVHMSGAGYYLGFFCERCGPWSRESGYFKTRKAAQKALDGQRATSDLGTTDGFVHREEHEVALQNQEDE